jgi:hypothetical protein
MTYTAVNPHACCNGPRPEDAHAVARPPPHRYALTHLSNNDRLRWKTDGRPPANGPPTTAPQQRRHRPSSPALAQTPHAPPQPAATATAQPKPRSGPHYGTEFLRRGPGEARAILVLHIISARPSKQPLMVRTFLKVYMELGSYFVSARTNKRHYHLLSLSLSLKTPRWTGC